MITLMMRKPVVILIFFCQLSVKTFPFIKKNHPTFNLYLQTQKFNHKMVLNHCFLFFEHLSVIDISLFLPSR